MGGCNKWGVVISVATVVEGRQGAFLHPNKYLERICLYLVRQFDAELVKNRANFY